MTPKTRLILRQLGQAGIIIVITVAAYFPLLKNGFIWDDDRYIEQNDKLHNPAGLEKIWLQPLKAEPQYYPLTHTSFWIEYHLWKLQPLGYHIDNVLLHLGSALLLWRLLLRLKIPGAFVASMIFAVHPVQVESVAWATERKNVLSGLFYLLAIWSYFHTRWGRRIWSDDDAANNGDGKIGLGWYALSLFLFLAALLSKSVTSTLPAAILLLCWWRKGRIRPADVWPLAPMFLAGAAMGSLTGWMEKHVVGAIGPDFDFLTPLDRFCIAGWAVWFYLAKLIWPRNLSFIYPHWQIEPWQLIFPISAIAVLAILWLLRKRISRGPVTAAFFFVGTLFPALGFVNVFPMRYSYVADHFQYLACIGPIVLAAAGLARLQPGIYSETAAVILIPILCAASNLRARVYLDRRTLWEETLTKNPDSAVVHNNYAVELMHDGQLEAARAQFRAAMEYRHDAGDWVGLGQCFYIEGNYAAARDMYEKAIAATPVSSEPVFQRLLAGRYFQLGTAYQGLAHHAPSAAEREEYQRQAMESYQRAIGLFPEYEDPRTNMASLLIDQNKFPEAIDQCRIVLGEDPDSFRAHKNLGAAYYAQKRLDPALAEYREALRIYPEDADAMASVGAILAQQRQINEAIAILEKALTIDPDNAMAKRNLLAAMKKKSK